MLEAARDQVTVTIDGQPRRISKAQAAVIQLANSGATGNPKLLLKFIDLIAKIEAEAAAAKPSDYPFSDADRVVIGEIYRRLQPYDRGAAIDGPISCKDDRRNLPAGSACIHPPFFSGVESISNI